MTNSLLDRTAAHRVRAGLNGTSRYGVKQLVYDEAVADIEDAIQRQKTLKHGVKQWTVNLFERNNPQWIDGYPALLAQLGNKALWVREYAGIV